MIESEPEPAWLTDEELDAIERRFLKKPNSAAEMNGAAFRTAARADIATLLAELRRLRAEWWRDHLMG